MKLVSIIIPTYGRPSNLIRAIDSVIDQTYPYIEIIIVDDNGMGTENGIKTSKVLDQYKGVDIVKYIQHEKNLNGSAARNSGIIASNGEYICFLDDDDQFLSEKINFQIEYLEKNLIYSVVYCFTNYSKNNDVFYRSKYNMTGNLSFDIFSSLIEFNTSALMFRKTALVSVGGFDVGFLRNQDYEIMIRVCNKFLVGCVSNHLLIVNVDSKINSPSFDDYIAIRSHFFSKMVSYLDSLTPYQKKLIWDLYNLDISIYAFRRFRFKEALTYFFRVKSKFLSVYYYRNKFFKVFKGMIK